uniref:GG11188 n=1 Tax=Drosophila erecta TaxID=7220 RepID=B3P7G4_DROER
MKSVGTQYLGAIRPLKADGFQPKGPILSVGDVTTVNLTQLSGGVQSNVVPPLFDAVFGIRLSITLDLIAFVRQIWDWCEEAGGDIGIEFPLKEAMWHVALNAALHELGKLSR